MATVCPQRCVYQACNYEETFPHICAALGDYALACASRGVLLQGWRSSVDNCSAWGGAGPVWRAQRSGRGLCGGRDLWRRAKWGWRCLRGLWVGVAYGGGHSR